MNLPKIGLLPRIILAIGLGILLGSFMWEWLARIFITFNGIFSNFLGFIIPLLIVGLVAPGIADVGRGAGRVLLITVAMAYGFTIFTGFFTYFSCEAIFPPLLQGTKSIKIDETVATLTPYFTIEIPPLMSVMTSLIAAFTLGLGMSIIKGDKMKEVMNEFRDIITIVISRVIIPLLPLYIFGIFVSMAHSGVSAGVMEVFGKIILIIFALTLILLLFQFSIAGIVARRNPLVLLRNMLPAYLTALGTQSSVATIPVTLAQTIKNGVNADFASFVIPLCSTVHLSGSTLKIVACSMAIMLMNGMPFDVTLYSGFILMLGVAMVAAPGVPGGAIMASLGLLGSMLGFDQTAQGLMIALYIAMDSFGTACNVTGDGAIAVIINSIERVKS